MAQLQIRNETDEELTLKCPSLLDAEMKFLVKKKRIAPNTTIISKIVVKYDISGNQKKTVIQQNVWKKYNNGLMNAKMH